jgi:hypothetical protein
MLPLILTLAWLAERACARDPPPYCWLDGCANGLSCQCVYFFQYCNVQQSDEGDCQFTTAGIIVIALLSLVALILLVILLGCLWCCCRSCCKRKKPPQAAHVTNNIYHPVPVGPSGPVGGQLV